MNTQQLSNSKPEVYSTSGFRDTLASPIFYPVIVVALVLGVTSIFGFVQNPLKLKAVVNVIQQKVATENVVNGTLENKLYSVTNFKDSENSLKVEPQAFNNNFDTSYELFSPNDSNELPKASVNESFERFAFNYDVTSESFWSDLDSSSLETASEEMERKEREATSFGAPLEIDHQDNYPADYDLQGKSIYALNSL